MRTQPVTSLDDPCLEAYRNVRDAPLLRRHGAFIAEGMFVVGRLLSDASRYAPRSLLVHEKRLEEVGRAVAASRFDPPVFVASGDAMDAIVGHHFHHGVIACGERAPGRDAGVRALLVAPPREGALAVVTEDLVDHDNVGSVFRNAAAFGASFVLLSPRCADPLYRKSVRTSMGHVLTTPHARCERWPDDLDALRGAGFTLAALTPSRDAQDIGSFATGREPGARTALLVGSEGPGLSARALGRADARVRIPIAPGTDSINVAAACAVALHRLSRLG